jgi:hypothetical protein
MLTPERRREIEGAIGLLDRGIWPGPTAEMSRMVSALLAEIDRLKAYETAIRKMAEDINDEWGMGADLAPSDVVQCHDEGLTERVCRETWDKATLALSKAAGPDFQ